MGIKSQTAWAREADLASSSLACLASLATFIRSAVAILGLMARTSSGSITVSIGPTSIEFLSTTMLPLLFRDGSPGRRGTGACIDMEGEDGESEDCESAEFSRDLVASIAARGRLLVWKRWWMDDFEWSVFVVRV